jgi:hypothetical protein
LQAGNLQFERAHGFGHVALGALALLLEQLIDGFTQGGIATLRSASSASAMRRSTSAFVTIGVSSRRVRFSAVRSISTPLFLFGVPASQFGERINERRLRCNTVLLSSGRRAD